MDNKKDENFSDEMERLMRESEEREKKMTNEEKEALKGARKRHARKVRVEMQGFDKRADEKKDEVFKKDENEEKK